MRPQLLTLVLAALAPVAFASIAAPTAAAADDAAAIARRIPIVDTHIDAPTALRKRWADLGEAAPDREFDFLRARAGGLDVAFMSIFASAAQDGAGQARQAAHARKDVSDYPAVIAGLQRRGYSEPDIARIMGGNLLRVWSEVEAGADPR